MEEVIIVGAGPCGLSAALELQQTGIDALIIEKHAVVHSIYQYPTYMQFFSTPELLEIGGIPFTTPNEKPSRLEALHYYRTAALKQNVRIRAYETVRNISKQGNGFLLESMDRNARNLTYEARYVIIATGYFDHPNLLGIPGEALAKVSHFFKEAHPYTGMKVVIIGGSNSAIDAALELVRVGAEVTIVYRGETYSPHIKPWVRPILESTVNKGRIRMRFSSQVVRIDETSVTIAGSQGEERFDNDFVLALVGFHPDRDFLRRTGIKVEEGDQPPYHHPVTMETNVPGLYLAGVVASSARDANEIFIETGRFHGRRIAAHIASRRNSADN